jgi:hypothetical protein
MSKMYNLGERVVKNEKNWIVNDFDGWGRGEGIGIVVDVMPDWGEGVDVRWDNGRCYERLEQIQSYEEEGS